MAWFLGVRGGVDEWVAVGRMVAEGFVGVQVRSGLKALGIAEVRRRKHLGEVKGNMSASLH